MPPPLHPRTHGPYHDPTMHHCGDGTTDVTNINHSYSNFTDFFLKCVVDMHIGKSIKKMTKMRHGEERVGDVRRTRKWQEEKYQKIHNLTVYILFSLVEF